MRTRDSVQLGDLYGEQFQELKLQLIKEGKTGKKMPQISPDKDGKTPKAFKKSGPENVKGLKKPKEDQKKTKVRKESINNIMSKLSFERLYENLMGDGPEVSDEQVLGIDDTDDVDAAFGADEGEGDEVTFTLDRSTAQALCDVLQAALGGTEDDLSSLEGEVGDEGLDQFEDSTPFGEEDEEQLGHPLHGQSKGLELTKPGSMKVGGNVTPKGGKAESKYTDKVGNDGEWGTPLKGQSKGLELTKPGSMKVNSKVTAGKRIGD